MLIPQIGCSTFGSWDFIRVPAPAARMTTAAGRLTVTWRCSLVGCLAGRARPRSPARPVAGRGREEFTCPTLAGYLQRPAEADTGAQHDGHHITLRDYVPMAVARIAASPS